MALYHRDEHYVVMEGKVQIVDASTGRIMPDRAWERGLHQMIETKEGLALTGDRVTLARITYQRLFRRYLRLAGMTGTATEVAAEIGRTYGLRVKRVPLHRPSRRVMWPTRCLRTQEEKWRVVADAVVSLAEIARRPVLVGTRTVRASEAISQVLSARDVAHVVLNAKQDRYEAEIIATAGHAGRISVATNMAGRGTDILLGEDVANRGGLHVILTEFNETARIDRQLFGRSARQGDAGSAQCIVAFDDELFITETPRLAGWLSRLRLPEGLVLRMLVGALCALAQYRSDRRSRSAREDTLAQDRRLAKSLAFTGRGE